MLILNYFPVGMSQAVFSSRTPSVRRLNSKDVTLRWSHRQGDFIVEPSFNLVREWRTCF